MPSPERNNTLSYVVPNMIVCNVETGTLTGCEHAEKIGVENTCLYNGAIRDPTIDSRVHVQHAGIVQKDRLSLWHKAHHPV